MTTTILSDNFSFTQTSGTQAWQSGCGWLPTGWERIVSSQSTVTEGVATIQPGGVSTGFINYFWNNTNFLNLTNAVITATNVQGAPANLLLELDTNESSYSGVAGTVNGSTVSWNISSLFSGEDLTSVIRARFYNQGGSFNITLAGLSTALTCIVKGMNVTAIRNGTECEIPVEQLRVEDVLKTRNGTTVIRKISNGNFPLNVESNRPYVVPKNYFGENMPYMDTLLSPGHSIFRPEGCFNHMYHSEFQKTTFPQYSCEYYHVATSSYADDIIYVNGIESETWDCDFQNKSWECDAENHICRRIDC
jgi:hypothetical protein